MEDARKQAWEHLIEPYEQKISDLKKSLKEMGREYDKLADELRQQKAEVEKLGVWKCEVCGSPNRYDREIHTFVCTNKECGYRHWYPERIGDIEAIFRNGEAHAEENIRKLVRKWLNTDEWNEDIFREMFKEYLKETDKHVRSV